MRFDRRSFFKGGAPVSAPPAGTLFSSLGVNAGDTVNFGPGMNVLMDVNTPNMASLTIAAGAVVSNYGNTSVKITAGSILNSGSFLFENAGGTPYTGNLTIELNGTPYPGRTVGPNATTTANDNGGSQRAFMHMAGSVVRLRANRPALIRSKLNANAAAGATSITLADGVYWKAGQTIAIGITDFTYTGCPARTDTYVVAADTNGSNIVTLTTGLSAARWGQLQYATWQGLSLTQGATTSTATFTGSISGATLTAAAVSGPAIAVGQIISGGTVAANTVITAAGSSGGQWIVSVSQTVVSATLTATAATSSPDSSIPSVLDERASVFLLSSNIVIQGANDSYWTSVRFGAHSMVMGITSQAFIDGVEFVRCGQGGTLGRYPWHWHMPSYDPATGSTLGTFATNMAVLQNCSVHDSANRLVSVHGTRGAVVQNNVGYRIAGHAIFLEDGSEELNSIVGNWVYRAFDPDAADGGGVFTPATGYRIKLHDGTAAGFWITNGNNTVTDNVAGDCIRGVWFAPQPNYGPSINGSTTQFQISTTAYAGGCLGLSAKVPLYPFYNAILNWNNNTGHSCEEFGAMSNNFAVDEAGDTGQGKIQSTNNNYPGPDYGNTNQIESLFVGTKIWKNGGRGTSDEGNVGGYSNRISSPHYLNWTVADNVFDGLSGQTDSGLSEKHLMIGYSLNTGAAPVAGTPGLRNGFATYHGTLYFQNIWGFNFSGDAPVFIDGLYSAGGMLRQTALAESWDLYDSPVLNYFSECFNWVCVNSIAQWRVPPRHIMQPTYSELTSIGTGYNRGSSGSPNIEWGDYTLCGALYDSAGALAGDRSLAGQYIVYDHPFFTTGLATKTSNYNPLNASHTVSTPTVFYGIKLSGLETQAFSYGTFNEHTHAQLVNKADNSLISGAVWDVPSNWNDSSWAPLFANEYPHGYAAGTAGSDINNPGPFHHVAVAKGSRVLWDCVNTPHPWATFLYLNISNLQRSDDVIEFGFSWKGSVTPHISLLGNANTSGSPPYQNYAGNPQVLFTSSNAFASLAAFNASSAAGYWQDTANNLVWVRLASFQSPVGAGYLNSFFFQCASS